jgi:hypothetical protein
MDYRLFTPLILCAVAWPFVGCRQSSSPSGSPNAAAVSGPTYSVEVRSQSGSIQKSVSGNVDEMIADFRLRVLDGRLVVNDQFYGQIKAGDAVLIESDGQVLVNLKVREPQ